MVYRGATASGTVLRVPGRSTCIDHTQDELRSFSDGKQASNSVCATAIYPQVGEKLQAFPPIKEEVVYMRRMIMTPDRWGARPISALYVRCLRTAPASL